MFFVSSALLLPFFFLSEFCVRDFMSEPYLPLSLYNPL